MMTRVRKSVAAALAALLVLSGCGAKQELQNTKSATQAEAASTKTNTPPVAPVIQREGNVVRIDMTAQVTNVEISKGVTYNAWTFNGTVPGPVLRVKEGDTLKFTL